MSANISGAIALAKDLLRTSSEFKAHDPVMAAQFAGRAYELCDDLGIDRAVITDGMESTEVATTMQLAESEPAIFVEETDEEASDDDEEDDPDEEDDESLETNLQLRSLLRQQAQVLKDIEEAEAAPPEKTKRRSFRLFGRTSQKVRVLQSA